MTTGWCFIDSLRWTYDQRSLLTIYTVQLIKSTSIQGCSKGARGLSVLPQVPRIFTGISISLSLCWRQRGSRYVIHAGRNLPDKEFRYLRTVIVTAAVYMGFHLKCYPHPDFTCQHRADVRLYTSSYDFAESCVFDKQSLPPFLLYPTFGCPKQVMFLPKLHIQFAEFLQHNYLKHLSILYPTTCVSFWYGLTSTSCFLLTIKRMPKPIQIRFDKV